MTLRDERRIESEITKIAASNDPFAAAVRTTRMPMLITDPSLPDNPIVFTNDAFLTLTGYARDEIIGQNCRFLQGPGTNVDDITKVRHAIARREAIEIDLLNYRKDGTPFWNRLLISPVFDESGALTYFFASQFDVTPERKKLSEIRMSHGALEEQIEQRILDLNASERRLRFILDAARMGVWTLALADQRLVASAQCKANFGRNPEEPFGFDALIEAIDPADREGWQRAYDACLGGGPDLSVIFRIRTPQGERRWIEMRGQLASDATDIPRMMTGITQEVTERQEAEEHRKLLARELNHRVKNSLATAQSIFAQSLKSAQTLAEAEKSAFGRIQAMSTAQDLLTQEGWRSAELGTLAMEVLTPFSGGDIRFGGPRVVLGEKAVSALSLALYELATNAAKYGALSVPGGSITVHWEIAHGPKRVLKFYWSEMNGPKVVPPTRRGFGTVLIESVVATALDGTAEITYRPDGILYQIVAELPDEGETED